MAFLDFYYIQGQILWYFQHLTNFYGVNLCSEKKAMFRILKFAANDSLWSMEWHNALRFWVVPLIV